MIEYIYIYIYIYMIILLQPCRPVVSSEFAANSIHSIRCVIDGLEELQIMSRGFILY